MPFVAKARLVGANGGTRVCAMPELPEAALAALIGAARRGRASQVEAVLAMHPGAAELNLHATAATLDAEGLARLLEPGGGTAASPGPGGLLPLELVCASELGDDERAAKAAWVLLNCGADARGGRAAFYALENGRQQVLDALIDAGFDPADNATPENQSLLHYAIDWCWKPELFAHLLERGADPDARWGPRDEPLLYTAVRRRRLDAVDLLLDRGAAVDGATRGGDTPWRHALRRPFPELAARLAERGARSEPAPIDALAVALLEGDLERARAAHAAHPGAVARMTPEEGRLLGDLAGQGKLDEVRALLDFGADLEARGLDGGTPLAQCAWFAQPEVARELLDRGADVHASGCDHDSTPLGWVAHGSRYSGGAEDNQGRYVALLDLLLDAGASVELPGDPDGRPGLRLWRDATEPLRERFIERGTVGLPPQ